MGIKELVWLACVAGCGEVVKAAPDAAIDAAAPDAFTCSGSLSPCGTSCFDLTSDNAHCGSCTTTCGTGETCTSSACLDTTASCAVIKMLDATKPSGVYTHEADGTQFYCDMDSSPVIQYDQLAFGIYNTAYPDMTMVTSALMADPAVQQAFIALYNLQGGGIPLQTWSAGNVCITTSPAGGTRMKWGSAIVFGPGTPQMNTPVEVTLSPTTVSTSPPLPDNFFQANPPSEAAACGDSMNPAFFVKRH